MTFSLPEPLASTFLKRVASRDRSRFVAEALAERFAARDRRLIAACKAANADSAIAEVERDMDSLPDTMADDPWIVGR